MCIRDSLGAEQRGDDHVAAALHLAVDLHGDPVAQPVQHEGLLRLGEAELPRGAGVLQRVQGARARAAVVPRHEHHVGVRLRDPGRDRAAIDAVHAAAVAAGVEVLHAPREWPEYHPGYYGVFLRDPDGHNAEAVHHGG